MYVVLESIHPCGPRKGCRSKQKQYLMPAYKGPQNIGSVLKDVIGKMGIQRKIDEARTVEAWAVLAGPQVNRVTESAWVRNDVLYVKVTSAAWRQELHLRRRQWCDRLNEQLKADLVREIVFR